MTSFIANARRSHRLGFGLTAVLVGYVAGTALQLQQPALWPVGAYAALAVAAAVAAALAWRVRMTVPLWLVTGALAAFAVVGMRAVAMQSRALNPALEGRSVQVVGIVGGLPQRGDMGWRIRFEVEQARLDDQPVALPPRLQLAWHGLVTTVDESNAARPLAAGLRAGDRWRLTVRLKAPHGNVNPHGFDNELWLWEQGIGATGYVRTGRNDVPPRLLAEAVAHPLERLRQRVRDRVLELAAPGDDAGQRRAGIVAALATGDQNAIERADWDVFRATGVAHLMSISGLHITMFAWLAAALVGGLWRRGARWAGARRLSLWLPAPNASLIGGLLLATGYALFSGWSVPAQRTVLMLVAVALLKLAGLRWPWWMTWLLACAVVLAVDPWAMLQAGFWLSFVAVGVLFATDSGVAVNGIKGRLRRLLHEQMVVTLALTPLSLLLFGQASIVGLLANLVAIPWVTLLITPLALLGVLWPVLWTVAAWALIPLIQLLQILAAWPWASVTLPAEPLVLGLAAVAGGLLLALRWPWPLRLAGLPLLLAYALWQPVRPAQGQFELLAADVGQGSAVLVRTANHTLLYDTGPRYSQDSNAGQRVLTPLLRALGERVDTLVLSHRDNDHTGGAAAVLAMQPMAALLSSFEAEDMLPIARTRQRCQAGQRWQWDGVDFELLHPQAADYASVRKTNPLSCVLRVRAHSGAGALLTGDIEAAQEAELARADPAALRADVLLAPHHGSRSSSSVALLETVQPRLALIQSGYRNRFGHPAQEVVARYRARGIRLADSPACGAMHWRSNQPAKVRCQRELARRYWWHSVEAAGSDISP
jgi:competence protein ComEC